MLTKLAYEIYLDKQDIVIQEVGQILCFSLAWHFCLLSLEQYSDSPFDSNKLLSSDLGDQNEKRHKPRKTCLFAFIDLQLMQNFGSNIKEQQ